MVSQQFTRLDAAPLIVTAPASFLAFTLAHAEAIIALKDRTGSSKHSIVQYLESEGHTLVNNAVNAALAKGKESGVLDTARGHGGSYIVTPATREVLKKKATAGKYCISLFVQTAVLLMSISRPPCPSPV